MLRRRRADQRRQKLRYGQSWQTQIDDLMFTHDRPAKHGCGNPGRVVTRHYLKKLFLQMQAAADLPKIRLHDFRHTAATLHLDPRPGDVHTVSRMLGHSSIQITADIYGHLTHSRQQDAADAVSAAVYSR